jgi:hypothetical protein
VCCGLEHQNFFGINRETDRQTQTNIRRKGKIINSFIKNEFFQKTKKDFLGKKCLMKYFSTLLCHKKRKYFVHHFLKLSNPFSKMLQYFIFHIFGDYFHKDPTRSQLESSELTLVNNLKI